MAKLYARVRLRPTRIGFLVTPSDRKSIREIMRINATLWGGQYNPIIPVLSKIPKAWENSHRTAEKGSEITKGYIKFFEPDVYVEAKPGLLEKSGLGAFRRSSLDKTIVLLKEFFSREYRGIHEPAFGQSVFDVMDYKYLNERQFQLRNHKDAIYPDTINDIFSEACIGVYPDQDDTKYLHTQYEKVYQPITANSSIETWLKVYRNEVVTPFKITDEELEGENHSRQEPVIFIFDPSKSTDIIELWNERILTRAFFPVPIKWVEHLSESLCGFIDRNYRPLRNNRNGVMHHTALKLANSISKKDADANVYPYFSGVKQGALVSELWHNQFWNADYSNHLVMQPERTLITADEQDDNISITRDTKDSAVFKSLSPVFADRYSGSSRRWANVLLIRSSYEESNVATCLPYNTFDRTWPSRGFSEFCNTREGWVFLQDHKRGDEYVSFLKQDEAFIEYYKRHGLSLEPSDSGRIARQMFESLDGFWGLYLFDDEISIKLINKMATSTRRRVNSDTGEIIE